MEGLGLNVAAVQGDESLARAKALAERAQDAGAAEGATKQVSEEFSALLGTMMVKELRKSLPDGFFGKGPGSDIMEGWLDDHVGRALADGWELDIAGLVRVGLENEGAEGADA